MTKPAKSRWRTVEVTRQELSNILDIFHDRGELLCGEPTAKAIRALPKPDREAGDQLLDLRYMDNVAGEPAMHEAVGTARVLLLLLDAGRSMKCALVHIKFSDSSEGCTISVRSTWRAAMADAVPDLEEALSVIKEEQGNT